TNALAQTLGLLLLWMLLRLVRAPAPSSIACFGVASAAALLTHVGALALAAAMLGCVIAFGWRRLTPKARGALATGALVVGALAVVIYFSAAIGPLLGQPRRGGLDLGSLLVKSWAAWHARIGYVSSGALLGYLPVTLAVALPGLGLLLRRPSHPS